MSVEEEYNEEHEGVEPYGLELGDGTIIGGENRVNEDDRLITFNYAKNTLTGHLKPGVGTIPNSSECMTKNEMLYYLYADSNEVSNYANSQLVPRKKFKTSLECHESRPNSLSYNNESTVKTISFTVPGGTRYIYIQHYNLTSVTPGNNAFNLRLTETDQTALSSTVLLDKNFNTNGYIAKVNDYMDGVVTKTVVVSDYLQTILLIRTLPEPRTITLKITPTRPLKGDIMLLIPCRPPSIDRLKLLPLKTSQYGASFMMGSHGPFRGYSFKNKRIMSESPDYDSVTYSPMMYYAGVNTWDDIQTAENAISLRWDVNEDNYTWGQHMGNNNLDPGIAIRLLTPQYVSYGSQISKLIIDQFRVSYNLPDDRYYPIIEFSTDNILQLHQPVPLNSFQGYENQNMDTGGIWIKKNYDNTISIFLLFGTLYFGPKYKFTLVELYRVPNNTYISNFLMIKDDLNIYVGPQTILAGTTGDGYLWPQKIQSDHSYQHITFLPMKSGIMNQSRGDHNLTGYGTQFHNIYYV